MSEQKPEVSELTKTLLESGLVDGSMVELLEKWGTLPEGASQYVKDDALKETTRRHLAELVEKISDGVEDHRKLRESYFDLDRLRWPKEVIVGHRQVTAMVDRMERFYFNLADVARMTPGHLAPGKYVYYDVQAVNEDMSDFSPHALPPRVAVQRQILEVTVLYVGPDPAAVQVSCGPEETIHAGSAHLLKPGA